MQPFVSLTGVAVPLLLDDVNTDQIAPADRSHGLNADLKKLMFSRWKAADPDFVLNRPQFQNPSILVARDNFACGSSREMAVWTMTANGIRCIVARTIADIFKENCLRNGVLAIELDTPAAEALEAKVVAADGAQVFTVDLPSQTIACPDASKIEFSISPAEKTALLEGLDDIGLTLKNMNDIENFEARIKRDKPWLQTAVARG